MWCFEWEWPPCTHIFESLVFSWWNYLRRIRRCGSVGEVCHWGKDLRFQKPMPYPTSVSACCLWIWMKKQLKPQLIVILDFHLWFFHVINKLEIMFTWTKMPVGIYYIDTVKSRDRKCFLSLWIHTLSCSWQAWMLISEGNSDILHANLKSIVDQTLGRHTEEFTILLWRHMKFNFISFPEHWPNQKGF